MRAFWQLMHHIAIVAGLTHLAFIGLFYSLGAYTLAWVNVGSVLLFAGSLACLRARRNLLAIGLILSEIFMHAVLAVRAVGWDSGFHYYILVTAPVLMISRTPWRLFKAVGLPVIVLAYLALDHGLRDVPPLDVLSVRTLAIMRSFNVVCTFALLAYLAHTYLQLVQRAERTMRELATTDPLTRLLNRRSLLEQAEAERQALAQGELPAGMAFVLADIDHFKQINDQHGHAAGDAVLVHVSEVLRQAVREQDAVARWGGEEFLILMPGADLATARTVAERLRREVAAIAVPADGQTLHVSMTLGVSRLHADDTLDDAVHRADQALYRGKVGGRNRVVDEDHEAQPA